MCKYETSVALFFLRVKKEYLSFRNPKEIKVFLFLLESIPDSDTLTKPPHHHCSPTE